MHGMNGIGIGIDGIYNWYMEYGEWCIVKIFGIYYVNLWYRWYE